MNSTSRARLGDTAIERADDIHAGVEGELAIYAALKARADDPVLKDVKLSSPGLDALIGMQTNGKLGAYLDDVVRKRKVGGAAK